MARSRARRKRRARAGVAATGGDGVSPWLGQVDLLLDVSGYFAP
jgi:hypothetical protein